MFILKPSRMSCSSMLLIPGFCVTSFAKNGKCTLAKRPALHEPGTTEPLGKAYFIENIA